MDSHEDQIPSTSTFGLNKGESGNTSYSWNQWLRLRNICEMTKLYEKSLSDNLKSFNGMADELHIFTSYTFYVAATVIGTIIAGITIIPRWRNNRQIAHFREEMNHRRERMNGYSNIIERELYLAMERFIACCYTIHDALYSGGIEKTSPGRELISRVQNELQEFDLKCCDIILLQPNLEVELRHLNGRINNLCKSYAETLVSAEHLNRKSWQRMQHLRFWVYRHYLQFRFSMQNWRRCRLSTERPSVNISKFPMQEEYSPVIIKRKKSKTIGEADEEDFLKRIA